MSRKFDRVKLCCQAMLGMYPGGREFDSHSTRGLQYFIMDRYLVPNGFQHSMCPRAAVAAGIIPWPARISLMAAARVTAVMDSFTCCCDCFVRCCFKRVSVHAVGGLVRMKNLIEQVFALPKQKMKTKLIRTLFESTGQVLKGWLYFTLERYLLNRTHISEYVATMVVISTSSALWPWPTRTGLHVRRKHKHKPRVNRDDASTRKRNAFLYLVLALVVLGSSWFARGLCSCSRRTCKQALIVHLRGGFSFNTVTTSFSITITTLYHPHNHRQITIIFVKTILITITILIVTSSSSAPSWSAS